MSCQGLMAENGLALRETRYRCLHTGTARLQCQLQAQPVCQSSGQVRSGQVRSECLTCTFRASCCSARLSRAQVPAFAGSSVWDRMVIRSLRASYSSAHLSWTQVLAFTGSSVRDRTVIRSLRTSYCSACLSWAHGPLSGTGKKTVWRD